jgi:hypothetical protein
MQTFFVGLSSWIIQDGNYGEFHVGDAARFALEFYPREMRVARLHEPMSERQWASHYRVRGLVAHTGRSAWVVDFGVMAYQNQESPHFAKKGIWVEGEVYLGVDPFFYFEELYAQPGMPALQYDWHIRNIWLETTPWLTTKDEKGTTIRSRDESARSFVEVAQTDAWNDDDGHAEYVLECEMSCKASR